MNLLEHYVLEVLEAPMRHITDDGNSYCTVRCRVECYGRISIGQVFCHTAEEAKAIRPGYMYLA